LSLSERNAREEGRQRKEKPTFGDDALLVQQGVDAQITSNQANARLIICVVDEGPRYPLLHVFLGKFMRFRLAREESY